jgi:hypothetical protein
MMILCTITMVVILVRFVCYTWNRLAKKQVFHPSLIEVMDAALVVLAILFFLNQTGVITIGS